MRHEEQSIKEKQKKHNKRKRAQHQDEDGHEDEGVAKVRRSDAASQKMTSETAASAMQTDQANGETRQSGTQAPDEQAAPKPNGDTRGMASGRHEDGGSARNEVEDRVTAIRTTAIDTQVQTDTSKAPEHTNQPWRPRFRILDALSATGLRALRYASEIPLATAVVANDREWKATKSIKVNVEHNKLNSMITTTTSDALGHMYGVAYLSLIHI